MDRQTVTDTLFSETNESNYWLLDNLITILTNVKTDGYSNITVSVMMRHISIFGSRPETDEELQKRIDFREHYNKENAEREYKQYLLLKDKYDN